MSITVQNIQDESWFRITEYSKLRPFLMNIVSDSNLWMFISSNGGVTSGRKNPQYALFPYYTDDKLTDLAHTTGSKTILQVVEGDEVLVWEPFSDRNAYQFKISRNLYKNWYGNKVMFEEVNHDLGLTFRYQWNSSHSYGFVKKSTLINTLNTSRDITVLDGIQNIMPYGVNSELQMRSSNLVNAYKRNELVKESGLGIFALSAIIVDKAEPSEALKANVAWSAGLADPKYLLSSLQLNRFRQQKSLEEEVDVKGEKGSYFVNAELRLQPQSDHGWSMVADVNLDQSQVVNLSTSIRENENFFEQVSEDIERGTQTLKELVGGADGLQRTGDPFMDARHFSNTLFNIMRGGTFDHNYQIEKADFLTYLKKANKDVYNQSYSLLNPLDDTFTLFELDEILTGQEDANLYRLGKEYLPLKFSRRHGDPSRPWNQFSINTHDELDGSKVLDYEGNWRDIFQNWEALAHSYPAFVEGMIFKFLNASTFDGYNPYRVTKDGFDWETIEPDDPWSYIGYWGDHQIIYLLKFLEFYAEYRPEEFLSLFEEESFVYANVPYRIKPYEKIVQNPKDTIDFEEDSDRNIRLDVEQKGADGALLGSELESIMHVGFLEKILAPVLAKVSNFIPGAGIWMNTQRPEWNDANNALVGNGVSMVTLCYLYRFLSFFEQILNDLARDTAPVSEELAAYFDEIREILDHHSGMLNGSIDDKTRKQITEKLGREGSKYREKIYKHGFSGNKRVIDIDVFRDFVGTTRSYLEHTIKANRRDDHLYHSYNLMSMNGDGISVSRLEEMLEGQVAVLSSGFLSAEESLQVLDALRSSSLYREDQQSYILYPNKSLPGFLQKNIIPEKAVKESYLLQKLVFDGDRRVIHKDAEGKYHFNGNFTNARDLSQTLDKLEKTEYASLVEKEREKVLQIFEDVFNHKAFTGRSGTFFAYEGLGSIYWHMVSKLHLAVEEVCEQATKEGAGDEVLSRLYDHFDEIAKGIGVHKSPEVYGAFPTDAYSHTPFHRGAQQPGMTGQVKEDILTRFGELGVNIEDGSLNFSPFLLTKDQFVQDKKEFTVVSADNSKQQIILPEETLGFTCCQVPVTYTTGEINKMEIEMSDGSKKSFSSLKLDRETSAHIFHRTGRVRQIAIVLRDGQLRQTSNQTSNQ